MKQFTKFLLYGGLWIGCVTGVAAGVVIFIDHRITPPASRQVLVAPERPAPFEKDAGTIEDFVIDAFRDPERLLALD